MSDGIAEVVAVGAAIDAMAERFVSSGNAADRAIGQFIGKFLGRIPLDGSQPSINGIVLLPMLVHGAETGSRSAAVPMAVVHTLWWASARYLDDLVDQADARLDSDLFVAVAVGNQVPLRLIAELPVAEDVRARIIAELTESWLAAMAGQLTDVGIGPVEATVGSVLKSYSGKTGAPYAMAAAMAAVLAGCDAERVDGWRDFGRTLGVLRQIVNDQRDIVTERDEDLRNGTATYLLVHALRAATPERRAELLRLSSQAGRSADARRMLREALLAPGVIDSYAESLRPLIARTHTLLDSFGGESSCNAELHALIDQTVGWFPQFRLG